MKKRMTAAAAGLATVLTAGIAAGEAAKEAHNLSLDNPPQGKGGTPRKGQHP
jgi:hypothetical protein